MSAPPQLPSLLSDPQISAVVQSRLVPAGTLVLREGDRPGEVMWIETGRLSVERDNPGGVPHVIAELGDGDVVGEIAFLDGAPRSANVRALKDTRIKVVSADALADQPDGAAALARLRAALTREVMRRMRENNDRLVDALQREVDALREREQFGLFFLYTFATLCIGTIGQALITARLVEVDIYSMAFGWQSLLIFIVPLAVLIWWMKLPLADLGISTHNIARALLEGLAISAALVVFLLALRWSLLSAGVAVRPVGFFTPSQTAAYAAHAFLQELLARGFLQSSYQRFLGDRRGFISVVLSSVGFGMFHLHYGLDAVVLTMLGGLVFGFIFLRHRNLAGVTLVHIIVGLTALGLGLI